MSDQAYCYETICEGIYNDDILCDGDVRTYIVKTVRLNLAAYSDYLAFAERLQELLARKKRGKKWGEETDALLDKEREWKKKIAVMLGWESEVWCAVKVVAINDLFMIRWVI